MDLFLKYVSALSVCAGMAGSSIAACAQAPGRIEMDGVFLEPVQERDSVLIADQLRYGFVLYGVEDGTSFAFPDYSDGFCEGVEVVFPWKIDTLDVQKGRKGLPARMDIRASVTVTSFDEGEYQLPPVAVVRRTPQGAVDTIFFGNRTLDVRTMPVDTATFILHDIKGQVRYPLTFRELIPYLAGLVVLAGLVWLAVWLILRYGRKGGASVSRRDPPHIVALRKLDGLRGNRLWSPEKQKQFYSGVTDALREYIVSRYGISAMEMTTGEIFRELSGKDVPEALFEETKSLFERADFVKFAKYVASDDENASAVPCAVRFVTSTYQQEVDGGSEAAMPAQGDSVHADNQTCAVSGGTGDSGADPIRKDEKQEV